MSVDTVAAAGTVGAVRPFTAASATAAPSSDILAPIDFSPDLSQLDQSPESDPPSSAQPDWRQNTDEDALDPAFGKVTFSAGAGAVLLQSQEAFQGGETDTTSSAGRIAAIYKFTQSLADTPSIAATQEPHSWSGFWGQPTVAALPMAA
jgi:hypothetical protein